MRVGAALAAGAMVAMLAASPACKPSSLTPFTDWREAETESSGLNGTWSGTAVASDGVPGVVQFSVAGDQVVDLRITHGSGICGRSWYTIDVTEPIDADAFELNLVLEGQGQLVVQGRFSSAAECSGTYFFEAISSTGTCPTSGSGSFVAVNVN